MCVHAVLVHEQPDGHACYRPPHLVRLLRVTYLVRGTARCCVLPWRVEWCRISSCRISVELMLPRRTRSYSCSPGNQIGTLPEAHIVISQASCDTMSSESLLPATRNDIFFVTLSNTKSSSLVRVFSIPENPTYQDPPQAAPRSSTASLDTECVAFPEQ